MISRQKTLDTPTSLSRTIYQTACAILSECWRSDAPVRLMTVTASGLMPEDEAAPIQLSFLEEPQEDDPRRIKLEAAIDRVRDKWGKNAVKPATPEIQ